MVATVAAVCEGRAVAAGLWYGLAVHLKVYTAVYAPAVALCLAHARTAQPPAPGLLARLPALAALLRGACPQRPLGPL